MLGLFVASTVISIIPLVYWMFQKPVNALGLHGHPADLDIAVGSLISLVT